MVKKVQFEAEFFKGNRARLARAVDGGIVVLTGFEAAQKTNDMSHEFWQEASFWYFTGVDLPGWLMIFDGGRNHTTLVYPERSEAEEIFDGRIDYEAIRRASGADEVLPRKKCEQLLRRIARHHTVCRTLTPTARAQSFSYNPAQAHLVQMLERTFASVVDCKKDVLRLRAIKQPQELDALRAAAQLSMGAFDRIAPLVTSGTYEYEIEAAMTHEFHSAQSRHAYEPIIASGKNACTLHYVANTDRLKKGQLVLIDVGARVNHYCADITRTYAVGALSARARDIHEAVTEAQRQIVAYITEGVAVREYIEFADATMKQTLCDVGLMQSLQDEAAFRKYLPHAVSHGLGIDTHDTLGGSPVFKEGMVLTVEPGVYVADEEIGVRIEDDVIVTKGAPENMTASLSTSYKK